MKEPQNWYQLKNAFRETPPAFQAGMEKTLRRLRTEKEEYPVKKKISLTLVIACIVTVLLAGAATAATLSPTVDWFGWLYGKDFQEELEKGDIAPSSMRYTLGEVTYTLDDAVYANGVLYGAGTIAVAEGKTAVLMPEDYTVDDPAGYLLHLGEDEKIPDDAPTYAQLAKEKGCKILLAKVTPDGYWRNGQHYSGDNGYRLLPQQDGTIRFLFEIYVGDNDPDPTSLPNDRKADPENSPALKGIQRDCCYTLGLRISNWEVMPEGEWLREEPNNTWLKEDWRVTVLPEGIPDSLFPPDNG